MMTHACLEREFANTKWGKQKGVDFFGVINIDTDYKPQVIFFFLITAIIVVESPFFIIILPCTFCIYKLSLHKLGVNNAA